MGRNHSELGEIQASTLRHIAEYHHSSLVQANACWIASLIAGSIGLAIVVIGVLGMFLGYVEHSHVSLAAAILADAVALLFHRQHVSASKRMSQHGRALLKVQLLIFASEQSRQIESPERQDDARVVIVTNVLSLLTDHALTTR